MRLGREIEDRRRLVLGEDPRHRAGVGDVGLHERHPRILQRPVEIEQAAGVGQLVEDDESMDGDQVGDALHTLA